MTRSGYWIKMNYKDFSSKIKTKYPQYSDMDDRELAEKISAKYPQYQVEYDEDTSTPPPSKPPILGGVTGAYSAPNVDIGPSYGQRVKSDIEEQGRKDVERQQQGGGVPLSKMGGVIQSMAALLRQAPGAYELGQPVASAAQKVMAKEPAPKTTGKFPSFGTYSTPAVDPGAMMKESPNLRSVVDIVTGAGEVVPFAVAATKGLGLAGKGIQEGMSYGRLGGLEKKIEKGIDKGIKPRFTAEKKTVGGLDNYKAKASDAVMAIDEYKDKINLVDSYGEKIALPRNNAEFAQAIEKTKEQIFKEYSSMASAASEGGVRFSTDQIQRKLDDVIRDIGNPDDVVDYAYKMKMELEKLNGASPEVIQKRIKYYNESLENYYSGRGGVTQAKAKVDASVANAMREELDDMITSAQGEGYQSLKNKYGALKAIEKDVNHRALQIAKKSPAGLLDMTDIFTGGEIAAGIMSMNPVLVAKGLTGKAAKEYMKWLNNPDKYIGDMFKAVGKAQKNNPLGMLRNQRGAVGSNDIITSVNPSGGIFTEYNPTDRASKMLKKNITTLDVTAKKNPDDYVTVYRGAPKSQKSIANGDFVTTNKQLALDYAGSGHVIEKKVKYSELLDDIDEPLGEEYILKENNQNSLLKNERGAVGIENPQVKSENFKKWFGDWEKAPEQASKVVDNKNRPMVVYRGGTQLRDKYDNDIPAYFTSSKDYASLYGDGVINDAYLDIKKPYIFKYDLDRLDNGKEYVTPKEFVASLELSGSDKLNSLIKELEELAGGMDEELEPWKYVESTGFRRFLKSNGFDGIIAKEKGNDIYSPLLPSSQIKSSTKNSGAFNPSNPDIRGSGAVPMLAGTAASGLGGLTAYEYFKNRK